MSAQRVEAATRADQAELFAQHARRLHAVVSATVRTSAANVDDACGFVWLQLVSHRPPAAVALAWLCTTAVREAIKLDRRMGRTVGLDRAFDLAADPVVGPDGRLELIVAGEQIRAARLRRREARVIGLRAAGYGREKIAELTGDSCRSLDRQLGRARRKLEQARRAEAA
jgi:DNA-directed RNA polymerase specialized sigma24 family protein